MFHEGLRVKEPLKQHLPCSHGHLGMEKILSLLNAELKPVPSEVSSVVPPGQIPTGQIPLPQRTSVSRGGPGVCKRALARGRGGGEARARAALGAGQRPGRRHGLGITSRLRCGSGSDLGQGPGRRPSRQQRPGRHSRPPADGYPPRSRPRPYLRQAEQDAGCLDELAAHHAEASLRVAVETARHGRREAQLVVGQQAVLQGDEHARVEPVTDQHPLRPWGGSPRAGSPGRQRGGRQHRSPGRRRRHFVPPILFRVLPGGRLLATRPAVPPPPPPIGCASAPPRPHWPHGLFLCIASAADAGSGLGWGCSLPIRLRGLGGLGSGRSGRDCGAAAAGTGILEGSLSVGTGAGRLRPHSCTCTASQRGLDQGL